MKKNLFSKKMIFACATLVSAMAPFQKVHADVLTAAARGAGLTTTWSDADEAEFGQWVRAMAESKCATLDQCLNSPANKFYKQTPDVKISRKQQIDCGRLPYGLRLYFEWQKNLVGVHAIDITPNGPTKDIRYTAKGNLISKKTLFSVAAGNPYAQVLRIVEDVNSGFFRVPTSSDDGDLYPIRISRATIRPGTTYYDPNGHVGIVYRVDADGTIMIFDAHPSESGHPEGSMSRKVFTRSNYDWGPSQYAAGGFKNFRPTVNVNGTYRWAKNSELSAYSVEQYANHPSNYYSFINQGIGKSLNPLKDFQSNLSDLCTELQTRVTTVDSAAATRAEELDSLPNNIWGADGDWEANSTPSSDNRIKRNIVNNVDDIETWKRMAVNNDSAIGAYAGKKDLLLQDLNKIYTTAKNSAACQVQYKNSAGAMVKLSLGQVAQRTFLMSFDPYQCVELRWGATQGTAEAQTCSMSARKYQFYNGEQTLRNRLETDLDLFTGYNEVDLLKMAPQLGPATTPSSDIEAALAK